MLKQTFGLLRYKCAILAALWDFFDTYVSEWFLLIVHFRSDLPDSLSGLTAFSSITEILWKATCGLKR